MAHTKAKGSTRLGRDSESKRLGVKRADGAGVNPGEIIVRQRGTKFYAGMHVRQGADDTLYALTKGKVKFSQKRKIAFNGNRKSITVVSVTPAA